MNFIPNKRFKKTYDKLFEEDPLTANVLLLLCELADRSGKIEFGKDADEELCRLTLARFENPRGYQL